MLSNKNDNIGRVDKNVDKDDNGKENVIKKINDSGDPSLSLPLSPNKTVLETRQKNLKMMIEASQHQQDIEQQQQQQQQRQQIDSASVKTVLEIPLSPLSSTPLSCNNNDIDNGNSKVIQLELPNSPSKSHPISDVTLAGNSSSSSSSEIINLPKLKLDGNENEYNLEIQTKT